MNFFSGTYLIGLMIIDVSLLTVTNPRDKLSRSHHVQMLLPDMAFYLFDAYFISLKDNLNSYVFVTHFSTTQLYN